MHPAGHVAELGAPTPGHDALELGDLLGAGKPGFTTRLLGAVLAQIIGASLEQRTAQTDAERGAHARQIAMEELVLQRARAGGDDGLQPGQQRRHQIRIGLARAGTGLGQQHVALFEGLGNGAGQAQLRGTWRERVELARQRPAFAERLDAGSGKLGHDGRRQRGERNSLTRVRGGCLGGAWRIAREAMLLKEGPGCGACFGRRNTTRLPATLWALIAGGHGPGLEVECATRLPTPRLGAPRSSEPAGLPARFRTSHMTCQACHERTRQIAGR